MKYYDIEHTPLKWHTFYRYFSMPIGAISGLLAVFTNIAAMDNGFYLIDIFFSLVQTVCCAAAFIGFFKWKSYAWYAVMANLAASVLYAIIIMIVNISFGTDQIAYSFGSVIGTAVSSLLIAIYYNKRKPLFFNAGAHAPADKDGFFGEPARVCPNCGAAVVGNGGYCNCCGSSLR